MTLRIDIAMNESALALFTPLLLAPPESLSPVLFWSLLGLIIGSFLNVVIYRFPIMMQRESDNYIALENDDQPPHTDRYNLMIDRKSTRLNSSHVSESRMPSSA